MPIDALASEPHFRAHIEPVWEALPPQLRGTFLTRPTGRGVAPVLVASRGDYARVRNRPVIYMEHGIGQTYRPGHANYAGGKGKERVGLFLSPNARVDELNRARYPDAAHAVIGMPLLDRWIGHKPKNREPVCAFAWHWNANAVAPEARSAFRHYANAIPSLPFKLLGHGHPRAMRTLRPFYAKHGIEHTDSFADVLDRADVLVFDNTSAGFMFAATGRPVVVLDAPFYRKAWGGRFWDWADVGVRIGDPRDLEYAILAALNDTQNTRWRRQEISREIFGVLDGKASQRASEAIQVWLGQSLEAAA
jgi:hypothetical protein